jgi:hypothetical protein
VAILPSGLPVLKKNGTALAGPATQQAAPVNTEHPNQKLRGIVFLLARSDVSESLLSDHTPRQINYKRNVSTTNGEL